MILMEVDYAEVKCFPISNQLDTHRETRADVSLDGGRARNSFELAFSNRLKHTSSRSISVLFEYVYTTYFCNTNYEVNTSASVGHLKNI